jgi:selenocysteine lyase/cysteine desulfurase
MNGKPLVYLDNAAIGQTPRAMIEQINAIYRNEYPRVEDGTL